MLFCLLLRSYASRHSFLFQPKVSPTHSPPPFPLLLPPFPPALPRIKPHRSLIDSVEVSASQRQDRLESELHGHKTNLIKESIRQSHNALGDFFYSRGDLQVCGWDMGCVVCVVCVVFVRVFSVCLSACVVEAACCTALGSSL